MVYAGIAVDSSKLASTYVSGFVKRNRPPQKARLSPMKAKTCEFSITDRVSNRMPDAMKAALIHKG
jgi:hypothetical protein